MLQQQTRLGWTHGRWTEDDVSMHLARPRGCAGHGDADGSCPQEKESVSYVSPPPNGQNVGVMAGATISGYIMGLLYAKEIHLTLVILTSVTKTKPTS